MNCSRSKKFFTCFENLSNEIVYEIFEYLDYYDIYQTFSNLNSRYYNLVNHPMLLVKLNLPLLPKEAFKNYCKDIIIPNQHRIRSIHSINPFLFDFSQTPFYNLFRFPHLRTLILENLESNRLLYLLRQSSALSNLSSLTIKPIDHIYDQNVLYQQIFCLPALNYCKVSFKQRYSTTLLPVSNHQFSPIQHLVIDHHCCINYLSSLLSYLPQLRRLSCKNLIRSTVFEHIHLQPIVLSNLTHLSIVSEDLNFGDIELFITRLFHQIQVFRLSADYDLTYLNAYQWERFILTNLPYLRIFDIQLLSRSNLYQNTTNVSINQFMTLFWFQRKWFFRYEYEHPFAAFYSIQPYRRNSYIMNNRPYLDTYPSSNKMIFHSVKHISIHGDISNKNNSIDFPNVTELTLLDYSNSSRYSISTILDRLIPLKNISKLSIDDRRAFPISQLMDLLYFSPNIQLLSIHSISFAKISLNQIQETQTYQTIFKRNKITHVTSTNDSKLETIQLFVHLCSRLEQLTIHFDRHYPYTIISSLEHIIKSNNVPMLCLQNANQALFRSARSHNCSVKLISSDLYIWS